MSGIYIHIPFCIQACHYCDFHFSTQLKLMDEMVKQMGIELTQRLKFEKINTIETVYFGGGTPSILKNEHFEAFFNILRDFVDFKTVKEITLEANPEDISRDKLSVWSELGINRVSLGVQSFDSEALIHSNRLHNAEKALESIDLIQKSPIHNFSVDLIFCLLPLRKERISDDLATLLKFRPPHVSIYGLTIEQKTVYGNWQKRKKIAPALEDQFANEFILIHEKMLDAGYNHYEISNYSLSGFESQHNTSYWLQQPYIGIGPAAHGYTGKIRYQNVSNNSIYIKKMKEAQSPESMRETLKPIDLLNEYLLTRIRTTYGLSISYLQNILTIKEFHRIQALFLKWETKKLILKENDKIVLTAKGMLLADEIALQLFINE